MQEVRKQNALLLKLINSKTKENQLLFQQYQQLASQNHQLEIEINTLRRQNRENRRSSITNKEQPRYTYAILNSPRTTKIQNDLLQLKNKLAQSSEQNRRLLEQVSRLSANQSNKLGDNKSSISQERLSALQADLSKKQKEMQELTLIMYAKDSVSAQIQQNQTQLNTKIKQLSTQIASLDKTKSQLKSILNDRDKQIKQLQSLLFQLRQDLTTANASLTRKQKQIQELQQILKVKQHNIEQLSLFMNEQAQELDIAKVSLQNHLSLAQKMKNQRELEKKQEAKLLQRIKELQNQKNQYEFNKTSVDITLAQYITQKQSLLKQITKLNQGILQQQAEMSMLRVKADEYMFASVQYLKQTESNKLLVDQSNQRYQQQKDKFEQKIGNLLKQIQFLTQKHQQSKSQIACLQEKHEKLKTQSDQYKKQAIKQLNEKEESIQVFMDILQKLQAESQAKEQQKQQLTLMLSKQAVSAHAIIKQLVNFFRNAKNENLSIALSKLSDLYDKQRDSSQEQGQQLRKSFSDLLIQNNSLKQEIDSFNESLDTLNALITERTRQLEKIEQNQKILRRQLQESQRLYTQTKAQLQQIQSAQRKKSKKKSGDNLQKQQYIEMLNAVIQSIKSQHEQSITKIQNKNMIIFQLEKRLKQTEDCYQQQLTTLRNSIFNQNEVISYEKLAEKYKREPKAQKEGQLEDYDQLMKEIKGLRQEVTAKDAQINVLSSKIIKRVLQDSSVQVEASQLRESNNSKTPDLAIIDKNDQSQHFYEQNDRSSLLMQNQEMHETISEQNYIIMELQENLMKMENQYNSEIIMLKRNIAQLNGEIIFLKKNLYQANPKSLDIATFISNKRQQFRPNHNGRPQYNYSRPVSHPNNFPFQRSYPSIQPSYRANTSKDSLKYSLGLQKTIKTESTSRKNPYIEMMTNEKGQLKFPQSGNWSIQQLRSLLQQPPK